MMKSVAISSDEEWHCDTGGPVALGVKCVHINYISIVDSCKK